MRSVGSQSWQIFVERGSVLYDLPLWIRAAERIETAGALVPGPLDIDRLPAPSTVPDAELAEGWTAWWDSVVRQPRPRFTAAGLAPPDLSFSPPDFAGLDPWPALRDVVTRRWLEAHDWHTGHKRTIVDRHLPTRPVENQVVADVERSTRRPVPPFVLEVIVLPVRDEQVRRVHEARYLVPERVHDGPGWADRLRPIVMGLNT